jgi:hypothetical protein
MVFHNPPSTGLNYFCFITAIYKIKYRNYDSKFKFLNLSYFYKIQYVLN